MARNRMENEFSEKLNQREIQPSAAAWDRLDAMLTATEAQPKVIAIRKNYKWLYVAAGFLGFLFVGTLFFKQGTTSPTPENTNVVATETPVKPETKAPDAIDVVVRQTPQAGIASTSRSKIEREAAKPALGRKAKAIGSSAEKQQIAANNHQNHQSSPETNQISQKTQLDQPVVIASHQNADALLAAAQSKRDNRDANVKVNAKNLLLQVDSQAEEKLTLKQKALRALNKNYQQVKVAVANRNLDENQ